MKNLLNIALVAMILIVLGCKCQKTLDEIKNQAQSPSPSSSSSPSASPSSSKSDSTSKSDSNSSGLTMETFNSLSTGMTFEEVNDKIGFTGTETFASGTGSRKVMSVKWEGSDYKIITAVFSGNKMTSKYQANLK